MSNRDRNDPSKALAARPTDYEVGMGNLPKRRGSSPASPAIPRGD